MKAVQINSYGGVDSLELRGDVPKPQKKQGQVLVEVHAASINPFDYKLRSGVYKGMIPLKFPVTMGGDFAGTIQEVGEGVNEFSTGDEVYGSAIILNGGSGAFAEFATANLANISQKPKNINFIEAASLPLTGSSAIQALEEHVTLQANQKILIHGGAGGIGTIAIQLAKALGAYVATTVSTDDREYVKQLGADEVIDYKQQKFEDILKEFDAVYDTIGGETTNKSFNILKKGGILVSMLGQPDQKLCQQYGITGIGQNTQTNAQHLHRLAELVENGMIKPHVHKVFPLEQVKDAFTYQEESHPQGKIVLTIKK